MESDTETGLYELIFVQDGTAASASSSASSSSSSSSSSASPPKELVVYLGEGQLKRRIDGYGRNGDTQLNTLSRKPNRHINDAIRCALSNHYSVYYRAWGLEKSRAFLVCLRAASDPL